MSRTTSTSGKSTRRLEHGGLEYLLADLLAFNLDTVNLRQIPRTEALLEQKIRSLESVEGWWFERLMSGSTTRHETRWLQEVPRSLLFDDYIAIADKVGVRRKQEETVFGMKLGRLVPNLGHTRRSAEVRDETGATMVRRVRCYLLPSLEQAREAFENLLGQRVPWPSETGGSKGDCGLQEQPQLDS